MEQMNPVGNVSGNASVSSSVETVCLFSWHMSMADLINLSIRVENRTCQEIVFQEPQELSGANWLAQMFLCMWLLRERKGLTKYVDTRLLLPTRFSFSGSL